MHEPTLVNRSLRAGLLALVLSLMLPSGVSAAFMYDVAVDTSTIAGAAGFIDLQFNPGVAGVPAATATLSLFDLGGGTLSGAPELDGDVTGALPGPVVFRNGDPLNALFQGVTFGSTLAFRIEFTGDFASGGPSPQTSFSVGILGPAPDYPALLGTGGPGNTASVLFELTSGSVTPDIFTPGSITAVPEPGTWMLLATGLIGVFFAARNRQHAR